MRNRRNQKITFTALPIAVIFFFISIFGFTASLECSKTSSQKEISAEDKQKIVNKISSLMNDKYVFSDIAKTTGEYLKKKIKSGHYDQIKTSGQFSMQLTEDLQKITKDKHIRVREKRPGRSRSRVSDGSYGFKEYKVLPGNIGYIDLRFFAPSSQSTGVVKKAMAVIENTDAIIFDMRKNGGGSPDGVRYLCSYLFDKKTHLNSLYWRAGDRTEEFWTREKVEGKKHPRKPVFVLTSSYTFSGAEEFTYNLQTRKRAIIIGETTGGGANPGGMFDINSKLGIFIPTGRAINPITKTNWEGVGVVPDIKVKQSEALKTALKLAKTEIEKFKKNK